MLRVRYHVSHGLPLSVADVAAAGAPPGEAGSSKAPFRPGSTHAPAVAQTAARQAAQPLQPAQALAPLQEG